MKYKCPICWEEFPNWKDLQYHMDQRENIIVEDEKSFNQRFKQLGFGLLNEDDSKE